MQFKTKQSKTKQFKPLILVALAGAALSLGACTTKPLTVDTPGPGATTVQVPVPATPDITLTTQVRAALDTALGSDAAGIDIRVEEGTVYLTGRVATEALRQKAISVASGTANVKAVVHSGLVVN